MKRRDCINAAHEIAHRCGTFTPYHLGQLYHRFQPPSMRALCNWLEGEALPTGTYDRLFGPGGWRVRDLLEATKKAEPLNEVCEHGCHIDRTYGFVVMAGCPIHD